MAYCADYHCGICDTDISSRQKFRKHLESWTHENEMDRLDDMWLNLSWDKRVALRNGGAFNCPLCDVDCPNLFSYRQHLVGKVHENMLKQLETEESESSSEEESHPYGCGVCDTDYSSIEELRNDLNGYAHQQDLNALIHRWSQLDPDERKQLIDDGTFDCDLCDCKPNCLENYIQHSCGKAHQKNLEGSLPTPTPLLFVPYRSTSQLAKVVSSSPSIGRSSSVVSVNTTDSAGVVVNYKCRMCGFYFPNLDQLRSHLEGQRHSRRVEFYRTKWPQLGMEERRKHLDEQTFYCDLCSIQSHNFSAYTSHFGGKGHQAKMTARTPSPVRTLNSQNDPVVLTIGESSLANTATVPVSPEHPVSNETDRTATLDDTLSAMQLSPTAASPRQSCPDLRSEEQPEDPVVARENVIIISVSSDDQKSDETDVTAAANVTVKVSTDRIFCHLCLSYCQSPCDYEAHRQGNITAESDGSVKLDESVDMRSLKCQCGITPDIFIRPKPVPRRKLPGTTQPQMELSAAGDGPTSYVSTANSFCSGSTLIDDGDSILLDVIEQNCQISAQLKLIVVNLSLKDPKELGTRRQQLNETVGPLKMSCEQMANRYKTFSQRLSELDLLIAVKLRSQQQSHEAPEKAKLKEEVDILSQEGRQLRQKISPLSHDFREICQLLCDTTSEIQLISDHLDSIVTQNNSDSFSL